MDNLYRKMVEFHGQNSQLTVTMEECAELIQAVSKFLREESIKTTMNLAEETAHVELMLRQVREIIGNEAVDCELAKAKTKVEKTLSREELGGNVKCQD